MAFAMGGKKTEHTPGGKEDAAVNGSGRVGHGFLLFCPPLYRRIKLKMLIYNYIAFSPKNPVFLKKKEKKCRKKSKKSPSFI
jgi:hypothetical protein